MRTTARVACSLLAIATTARLLAAASPPLVAMRVDLEPLAARGEATAMEVVVQVAPEDRPRIGASAWVELELRRGRETVNRASGAVEVDGQGRARLDVVWPPGPCELSVEIRSARGDARGLWTDRVTVPTFAAVATPTPAPTSTPQPVATPEPPTAPEATAETAAPAAAAPLPPPAEMSTRKAAEVTSASTVKQAPTAPPPNQHPPVPSREPDLSEPALPAAAEATTAVAPASGPLSHPVSAPHAEPADRTAEVTVLITRMQRPVPALAPEVLGLKLEGKTVPIDRLAGPATAPLSLALAVDLSSTMEPHLPELRRLLGQLVLHVTAGGGAVSLVTGTAEASRALDWDADPVKLAEALRSAGPEPEGNLAAMVAAAFTALVDRPGRRLVMVVCGGGDTASRDDWRRVEDAAAAAAAPILVVELEGRSPAALDRLVDACGGESFSARTDDMAGTVLRHYGDLLEACYAVRFERPRDAGTGPLRVKVTTADDTLEVRYPKQVR